MAKREEERCANCDYCKHCGKSKLDTPPVCTRPHYPNYYPTTPYITWGQWPYYGSVSITPTTSTTGSTSASGNTTTLPNLDFSYTN